MVFVYEYAREIPVDAPAAFAWLTDFREEDARFFGAGAVREVERAGPDSVRLVRIERRGKSEERFEGTVTLEPPLAWRYAGIMHREGKHVAELRAQYRLESLGPGRSRYSLRFEAQPLSLGIRVAVRLFPGRARVRGTQEKVLGGLVAELGGEASPSGDLRPPQPL